LKCAEPEEDGPVATLVREACEENQVRIGATAYLGYAPIVPRTRR
jgi:hypothetical protein